MKKAASASRPILIVDDSEEILIGFERILKSNGFVHILTCSDSRKVMEIVESRGVSILLLDLNIPFIGGEDLMAMIRRDFPEILIIVITGMDEVEVAVRCMRNGAYDFLVKPVEKNRLLSTLKRAVEQQELQHEMILLKDNMLRGDVLDSEAFSAVVTGNSKMKAIFRYIEAFASTSYPVLISGETGVGKDLIAEAIHKASGRRGPLVAVNVAGLDDNVFSDTLFGHVRGAYTGAEKDRLGMIEKAAGGTLFLDEIGDLALSSQVKLLRLLQSGEFYPLGSDKARRTDARIVIATNRDLHAAQEEGSFRKDLYFRLKTHHVHIPPLRERVDDLPLLPISSRRPRKHSARSDRHRRRSCSCCFQITTSRETSGNCR